MNPQPTTKQNTTPLQQAFIALCGSYSNLFTIDGLDKQNDPISFEIVIDSAQKLIDCAEQCRAEKSQSDRAFKQALFDTVPMENNEGGAK